MIKKIYKLINTTPREIKIISFVLLDCTLCFLTVLFSYFLRFENFNFQIWDIWTPSIISIICCVLSFWYFDIYRVINRFSSDAVFKIIIKSFVIYGLIFFSIISVYTINNVPRSIGIIQPLLLFVLSLVIRFFIKARVITSAVNSPPGRQPAM